MVAGKQIKRKVIHNFIAITFLDWLQHPITLLRMEHIKVTTFYFYGLAFVLGVCIFFIYNFFYCLSNKMVRNFRCGYVKNWTNWLAKI